MGSLLAARWVFQCAAAVLGLLLACGHCETKGMLCSSVLPEECGCLTVGILPDP